MFLRPGTFLQDRYEILEQIGSGGMSDVYKVLCHKLNRMVAIKVLKEEFSSDVSFVGKFKMEAQAAGRLSHPNIVNVFDVVDEENLHYIVMELIEGATLKSYIGKKGVLDSKEVIGIAIQVAQGIDAAHKQGIIHRDIKPQNIMIARDGKVKVTDFGIARAATSQTLSVNAMGSVHYISPEQARGGYSDARSDVYSLGITMYEMAAGRVPFEGENTVTVALAHLEDPITPPSVYNPDIAINLENIILKCTEKKPEYRYQSIQEVINDLRRSLITPNEDFVQPVPSVDNSQTVIISQPEMQQIRSGRRPSSEPSAERMRGGVTAGQSSRSYDSHNTSSPRRDTRSSGRPSGKHKNSGGDDISPKIERILTIAGVAAAIIIVAVVIFVFSKLGGLFNSSSTPPTSVVQTTEVQESTLSEKQVLMPDVVGLNSDIAKQKLKESGSLDMKISSEVFSDTTPVGDVLSQIPVKGTVVDKYTVVTVILSKGPERIELKTLGLEALTADAAKALLEGKGFLVKLETVNSDTIEAGKMISVTPDKAKPGETVTITASLGKGLADPTAVPDLFGKSEELVGELLADAGLLEGSITKVSSEEVPTGSVISQSIPFNTQVEKGTTVDYVVSTGTAEQSKYKYLSSIDKSYPLQNVIGPGSSGTQLTLKIQLRQNVNGKDEVKDLMAPFTITADQLLPVVFKNIEGAYGVTSGQLEIVNVDTGDILNSYPLTFIPVPQS